MCFVMPLMSCSEMCKQLWSLSQVQGVRFAVCSAHCIVHTPRQHHVPRSMSYTHCPSQVFWLSGSQLRSDHRLPLIRDVCLPCCRAGQLLLRLRVRIWVRLRVGEGAHLSCERNNNDLAKDLVQPVCKSIKCIASI